MKAFRTRRRRRRIVTHARSNHARNLAPPPWVDEVVAEVRRLFKVPSKRLLILWRHSARQHSSGHTKVGVGEIVITAGTCDFDAGDTLLHELAHWLCRPETAHRMTFWLTYWKLIRHFGLNEAKCLQRCGGFSSKALAAYRKLATVVNS